MPDGTTFQAESRNGTDLIVQLWPTFNRLMNAVGTMEPAESKAFENMVRDQAYDLEHIILSTPATSLEGAFRQLQILVGILDSAGGDLGNINDGERIVRWLTVALCGAVRFLAPQFADELEGEYHRCSEAEAKRYPGSVPAQFQKLTELAR